MLIQIRNIAILSLFMIALSAETTHAQKQGNIWYFGEYAGIDFNSGAPVALTNSAMFQYDGCATISDNKGKLLFYTNGMTVWNKNHLIMENGTGLMGGYPSTQSSVVVQRPLSDSLYYIFTVDDVAGPNGFRYSVVNMSLKGGLGEVITKNIHLLTPTTEKVTAVKHRNDTDVWVITHGWDTNAFYAYLVTKSGIKTEAVISKVGVKHGGSLSKAAGYMKASPNGKKLAIAIQNYNGTVEMLDFDDSTGVVSNPITVNNFIDPYGIEFSPDGTKLFVTSRSRGEIYQFFLEAGTNQDIINSMILVGTSASQIGAMQVAIDAKIYVARNDKYLGVFHNPNAYGSATNYSDNGVYLAGKNSKFGLPTFNQSYFYNPEFTYENFCYGDTTKFTIVNSSIVDSVHWYFGDMGSTANFSNSYKPAHRYSAAGNYEVGLLIYLQTGKTDSITWTLKINPKPVSDFTINKSTQCLNENQVLFVNSTAITSGTTTSLWHFDDGDSSTNTDPLHKYRYDDTFQVRLISKSDKGCLDTMIRQVIILPSPNADFIMEDSAQCFDKNKYEFINSTTINYGLMSYKWDFGDGVTSTTKNPVHTYTTADTFIVRLIATSQYNCPDTVDKKTYVHINPSPHAHFTINDTFQCLKDNLFTFKNNSSITSGTISFIWSYGDGDTSKLKEPDKIYAKEGKYPLTLTVVSDKGCKDRKKQDIYVNPMPKASFTMDNPNQCLRNNTVKFTNTTTLPFGKIMYLWDFGDGLNSNLVNPEHKFVAHDTFDVELLAVTEAGCRDSAYSKVFIYPMPLPEFRINDNTQCLSGNSFVFNDESTISSGKIINYSWKMGDSKTYTLQNVNHSYTKEGTYDVCLTLVSGLGCRDSVIKKVYVYPMPDAYFTINNVGQCLDKNFFICKDSSKISSGTIASLLWNMGDGKTYTDPFVYHNYLADGTYDIKLTTISNQGCKDSLARKVIVYPLPKANFDINNSSQCINGNSFVFTDKTTIKSGYINTRFWNLDDGTTSYLQNVTHSYTAYKGYNVKLLVTSDYGCKDSIYKGVSVHPMPKALFSIDNDQQCLKDNLFRFSNSSTIPAGTINTSNWAFGDGGSSLQTNPTYSYVKDNTYKVKLKAVSAAGCIDSTEKSVTLFPMPQAKLEITNPCLDETGIFTDKSTINSPGQIVNWQWDLDGAILSNAQDAQKTFTVPGHYKIRLQVISDHNCMDDIEENFVINPHVSNVELIRSSVLDDNSVIIEWTAAAQGAVRGYILEKSGDGTHYAFLTQASPSVFSFNDKSSDASLSPVYYRVYALDSCNYQSNYSNIGKTIHLNVNTEEEAPILSWTPYENWNAGIDYQEIQLKLNNTSFNIIETVDPVAIAYTDQKTVELSDNYCYRIVAYQAGSDVYSVSNTKCISFPLLIFAPNSFTPNYDGVNDYFEVKGKYITEFEIVIFDRWGEEMFRSTDMNKCWDGKYSGQYCPPGVYPFVLRASGTKGQHETINGSIHLLR